MLRALRKRFRTCVHAGISTRTTETRSERAVGTDNAQLRTDARDERVAVRGTRSSVEALSALTSLYCIVLECKIVSYLNTKDIEIMINE